MLIDYKNNLPDFIQFSPSDEIKLKLIANAIEYKELRSPISTVDEALKYVLYGILEEGWTLNSMYNCLSNSYVKQAYDKYIKDLN